jgi:hypothetical protein
MVTFNAYNCPMLSIVKFFIVPIRGGLPKVIFYFNRYIRHLYSDEYNATKPGRYVVNNISC